MTSEGEVTCIRPLVATVCGSQPMRDMHRAKAAVRFFRVTSVTHWTKPVAHTLISEYGRAIGPVNDRMYRP